VPGDAKLVPVLTKVAVDLRELPRCCDVLRARTLALIGQLLELTHHLLRFGALRADRRVGKRRDCGQ
jgi:hypothetical protein